jgi:hypothetical protein
VRAMRARLAEWQANGSDAISTAHGELRHAIAAAGAW